MYPAPKWHFLANEDAVETARRSPSRTSIALESYFRRAKVFPSTSRLADYYFAIVALDGASKR